jgi:hypothetical protein
MIKTILFGISVIGAYLEFGAWYLVLGNWRFSSHYVQC